MISSIQLEGDLGSFRASLDEVDNNDGVQVYRLKLVSDTMAPMAPLNITWQMPGHNIKGVWTTNALHEKRLKADWESASVESRVSVEAPVLCLFSHDDDNALTFAVSDVINTCILKAPIREENNLIYCSIGLFSEPMPYCKAYEVDIRIDSKGQHFSSALQDVGNWWASFPSLKPMPVFDASKLPLYSTWYSYHQSLDTVELIKECKSSKKLGNELIIIDDGWQTNDSNRGYDFTGDWKAERMTNIKEFVQEVHGLDMKVMLWFSVPFCGVKSEAYKKFKGKFLTENHRWAPVFDPRYPEVRKHLIDIYSNALRDWNLDGFKLDFIDDFKVYPETVLTKDNGRDYSSVNEAVDRLMSDVSIALSAIKSDILIEFRQKYIGPAMRKYGNMFRAFDCPNDSVTNRIRTTDVKLLCGSTAVHSDMFTWHKDESVELAALQFTSILFSVPQLSVKLEKLGKEYKKMIEFYTKYWRSNRSILLDGEFIPYSPLANYPILSSANDDKIIFGVYENMIVEVDPSYSSIDLVNGKMSEQIAFEALESLGKCSVKIYNCMGDLDWTSEEVFDEGIHALEVPANGMICIEKIKES